MHFTRLRVSGFKSFVDPVELLIEPGITGIVGPNGCGKSNVVEALRWVMGETSAKSLRGDGMDDVIFGGTTSRPPRNVAEVVLHLDNFDRKAPAIFNDADELEISRRIERDAGSTYRVNGREVRARDVQLLFADLATGAHSTALVSQGRITAMIGAKPAERRVLLEEAAGIRGLHSRRHEAELRLRAADANLERLDDVVAALAGQYQGLQRQARQAARYRRLSEQIRRFESILLHHLWTAATENLDAARSRLAEIGATVVTRSTESASAATLQADAAAVLPALRRAEAEAAAALQHLQLAHRELDAEAERVTAAGEQSAQRLQQIAGDIEREKALEADATAALERLEKERDSLAAAQSDEAQLREAAAAELAQAAGAVEEREAALHAVTSRIAEVQARRDALDRRIEEIAGRIGRLDNRRQELETEHAARAERLADERELSAAAAAVEEAESAADKARETLESAEAMRTAAESEESATRSKAHEAEARRGGLAAELEALGKLLDRAAADAYPPVIDDVSVEAGFEAALGTALGDDLEAAVDPAAPVRWGTMPALEAPPLPEAVPPLARFVRAPAQLARRLATIGVVESAADGARLAASLLPGQRLVTRDGGLWRWDGFVVTAGAATAAATRLAQRNRLEEIRAELRAATAEAEKAGQLAESAAAARTEAAQGEREARDRVRETIARVGTAREAHARLVNARATAESQLTAVTEALRVAGAEREEAETELTATRASLDELEDPGVPQEEIGKLRLELAELRAHEAERRSAHDRLTSEAARRSERLLSLESEIESWRQRASGAAARLTDLASRRDETEAEQARLAARPGEIAEQRRVLLDRIAEAQARRNEAADRLAAGETAQAEADRTLRAAEAALAQCREDKVRAETLVEQAARECEAAEARIREKLDVVPDGVLEAAGVESADAVPDHESAGARVERLLRERDAMGPVNLRAEREAAQLKEQIDTLQTERDDLVAAIARLRQGIGALNREGRERLMAAFADVNRHFEELFARLFGGGSAHLALTEADDPLEAGLEIMASPPGKKLTTMSLLSGGEQALTAVALLFAVFLTNPAPICVLDEVDAPLDDSNVDRFCSLLDELAHAGDTRFLLITHHRMTMARMDRLFGVTMGEPGVSQLVSVDLRRAAELRESA